MIAVDAVVAGYGKRMVLDGVTLRVQRGEHLGLVGPNGCGKTTLLRVMASLLKVRRGTVRFDGKDLAALGRRELARKMACLPQSETVNFSFTVTQMVLMGRWPHRPGLGNPSRRDVEALCRAMELTGIGHLAHRLVTELSGGERHRVGIAMCLAQEPEVILLDEPLSHLDIGQQLSVVDLIRELGRSQGVTVVSVLHDLNLAAEYCDRLALMDRGRIVAAGAAADVLTPAALRDVFGVSVRSTSPQFHSLCKR